MKLRLLLVFALLVLQASFAHAASNDCVVTSSTPSLSAGDSAPCYLDTSGNMRVTGGAATIENADGAITDGVTPAIKATVKDYANSNPLAIIPVDTNGDPASIGGGTQYQQGTASTTTDTMTMAGCVRVDTPAVASGVIDGDRARCIVDSTGRLWVHVGVIDGTVAATQSGTWNIGTLTSITNPVAVTGTFWQSTQPVSGTVAATQSGTWTVQPGNTANTTPWLATINQGGNSATVNGSGQLAVNCANCSGSGVSQQDNTGFTPGTTNFVPMGGEVDDTGTTAVTENNAGVARITAQRAVHMNLRNNSGTEIGTSGNPVRTDPTGSTTQPVSGTVTANAGTGTFFDGIIKDGTGDTTQANVIGGRLQVENYNANLAADNSTNSTSKVPVLGARANASAPTWTEGNQVPLSTDLSGALRVTGGTAATQYTEDAASAGAESMTLAGTIRQDTPAGSTSADGDYANLKTDSVGRLWVNNSGVTQPVSGTVSITANSAVNVAQINGVTPLMGAGNTGTGSPRVTIATDQAALPGMGVYVEDAPETTGGNLAMAGTVRRDTAASSAGTTGDNATLNTDANGLLWTRTIDPCSSGAKTFLPINISTATTTEITPSLAGASTNYYVCSLVLVTAAANNVALVDDDSDGCGSVTSGMAGGTTAASGFNLAANSGLTFGNGMGAVFKTNGTNRVICLVTSAATQLSGTMTVVAAP